VKLNNIKKIIVIASGKGGVGKSTIAANLALSLSRAGNNVGLLDADIYGPSVAKIFDIDEKPVVENGFFIPIVRCGIKLMSMGFLVSEDAALIWRGPMITKALHQLFQSTKWGGETNDPLDYLIVDTPPGTGDIHLTIAKSYDIDSAIIITTPHELSVIDAFKTYDLFKKLNVKVGGVMENMSYVIEENSKKKLYIFGESKLDKYCVKHGVKILAKIPFLPLLRDKILTNKTDSKNTYDIFNEVIKVI
jgi:ATP-binding protein involved in chromosome partitioning